jgi:hypothetical protein
MEKKSMNTTTLTGLGSFSGQRIIIISNYERNTSKHTHIKPKDYLRTKLDISTANIGRFYSSPLAILCCQYVIACGDWLFEGYLPF